MIPIVFHDNRAMAILDGGVGVSIIMVSPMSPSEETKEVAIAFAVNVVDLVEIDEAKEVGIAL